MSSSIYQVGVHLTARDGVSGVLANISRSMLGLHGGIEHLNHGFASLQVGVLGAAAVAAGVKIGHVVTNLVEHGMELKHWQAQLAAAGFTAKDVAEATAKSWEVAGKNMNTTAAENLKNIIELNKATGNLGESMKLLPTFAVAENVIASVKATDIHSKLTANSTQTLNFARGLEELGVTQMGKTAEEREANVKKYAAEMIRTMIASRGLFDGSALYAMTNNSGGAAQNWDMRMATAVAPILGDIMKASKLGNADYMALRSYQGGHITGDAAEALLKYHLVGADDLKRNDKGKIIGLKANTDFAKGMDTNIWDWSAKIIEKLKASGMNVGDQHAMNAMINEIGSNKTTTGMLRAVLEPLTRLQIQKELTVRDKVGPDAAGVLADQDPLLKIDALHKKWDDFLMALGSPLVDPAMKALDLITHKLNDFAQYFAKNPEQAALVGKSLVALSVGLTALGTVLIGSAVIGAIGAGGWLVLGMGALGAAMHAINPQVFGEYIDGIKNVAMGIVHMDWSQIKKGFTEEAKGLFHFLSDELQTGLKGLWQGIRDFNLKDVIQGIIITWTGAFHLLPVKLQDACTELMKEIESWPGRLAAAIADLGRDLVRMIGDKLKSLAGEIGGIFGGLLNHTSFEGSGGGGSGGFIKASYETGGGGFGGGGPVGGGLADEVMNRAGGSGFNTRGVRNLNPGNIGWGAWARAHGATGGAGSDTGHLVAVFPSFEAGYAAMGALALAKYHGGYRSMNQLISGPKGWTPGNFAAAANVARMMGIAPGADAHLDDPSMLAKFKAGLSVQELGPAGARFARDHLKKMPGAPPVAKDEKVIQTNVHLDGKVLARVVTKQQTRMAQMPHAIGGQDDYGSWASPGTTMMPA